MGIMNSRKTLGCINIAIPIAKEKRLAKGEDLHLTSEFVCNSGLYGDRSRGMALSSAYKYTSEKGMHLYVVTASVRVSQEATDHLSNRARIGSDDLGNAAMINITRTQQHLKADARNDIDDLLIEEARKRFGHHVGKRAGVDWLAIAPNLINVIFDEYPALNAIITECEINPFPGVFTVAQLRQPINHLMLENIEVKMEPGMKVWIDGIEVKKRVGDLESE